MKNLYIIGNGFDLYHGLDTRYQSFGKYLADKNKEVYSLVLKYFSLPNIAKSEVTEEEYAAWASFEHALANLDYEQVLDDFSGSVACPGSDDFRDRDWNTYTIDMELIIEKLTKKLIFYFNNFILNVAYPPEIDGKRIRMFSKSLFLNFNYTETIEKYYGINEDDICYIHNKAKVSDSNIILGHGTNPDSFIIDDDGPPQDLSEEDLERWHDYMGTYYDFSYESAKSEILTYYTKAFKDIENIINQNRSFFKRLSNIENVYVLGHSMSEVDIKYFQTIVDLMNRNIRWFVTYYGEFEKQQHLRTLLDLGIKSSNFTQLKLEELK